MRALFLLSLLFATALHAHWLSGVSWDNPESRCVFLLGMGSARGSLVGGAGFQGFWPSEKRAAEVFDAVARLYAADLGVRPEQLATDAWKAEVAKALDRVVSRTAQPELDDAVPYLAGAYVRWGTPTGYRRSGTAYDIAERLSSLNEIGVQLVHTPGYPGGTTITVVDGGDTHAADFFSLMHAVTAGVKKEPNQTPEPMPPSVTPRAEPRVAPAAGTDHP